MVRSRLELIDLLKDYKVGAEIGVFSGYFSEQMCRRIKGLKLYCIDPYAVYKGYRDHKFVKSMEKAEAEARERLEPYDVTFIKKFSAEAAEGFEDGSLDFVYIDGNHEYGFVKQDIELWTSKVRPGGIVAGDDYYMTRAGNLGVIKAVHEYVDKHGYDLNTTTWNLDDEVVDNQQPAWWFTK